jgi:hypothetical protein
MHAAAVKPTAATSVKAASASIPTAAAAPTSERVIRDEAGAD